MTGARLIKTGALTEQTIWQYYLQVNIRNESSPPLTSVFISSSLKKQPYVKVETIPWKQACLTGLLHNTGLINPTLSVAN